MFRTSGVESNPIRSAEGVRPRDIRLLEQRAEALEWTLLLVTAVECWAPRND